MHEVQQIHVVALTTGRTVWNAASQTPIAAIDAVGDVVVVASDRLRAYDIATRAQRWDYSSRGGRTAITGSGNVFVAHDDGLSLVDGANGHELWSYPYPANLVNAAPDWAGVDGDLGYATFRPKGEQREPLDFDAIAVHLGPSA
jgi:outer membrane protein assembly factor BamB